MVSSYAITSSLKETISLLDPPSWANTLNVPTNRVITINKINPVPKEKSVFNVDTLFLTIWNDFFIACVVFWIIGLETTCSVDCFIFEVFILFTICFFALETQEIRCSWISWFDSTIDFLLTDLALYSLRFCLINLEARCLDSITVCLAATLTLFVACTCGLDLTEASSFLSTFLLWIVCCLIKCRIFPFVSFVLMACIFCLVFISLKFINSFVCKKSRKLILLISRVSFV